MGINGKGAPAFYILVYLPIGYAINYFVLPPIWRIGKERGLMTWPDFFIDRYGSKTLGGAIAVLQRSRRARARSTFPIPSDMQHPPKWSR